MTSLGRICAICGKGATPKLGMVSHFEGLRSHPKCFDQARNQGRIIYEKGQAAKLLPVASLTVED